MIQLFIERREPFAEGKGFGRVGPYERLSGWIHFAIDPDARVNRGIVDLEHAPRNPSRLVEYDIDFYILKPVELARGNRRLIYDVNNRGNKRILQFFNDAIHSNEPIQVEHAGNGFLMRRGYTVVWSGWQGNILPGDRRLTMKLPIAMENGKEITGVVRSEFISDDPDIVFYPLSGNEYTSSYETVSLDTALATFTKREYEDNSRELIPPDEWQFAQLYKGGNLAPSTTHCYLPAGFQPGWIYELIYTARGPPVLGLGFTGVRDLVSFLLYTKVDENGTSNPLKQKVDGIEKAYAWGRSQSGRFLREFIYQGFNEDAQGRRVFDAIFPHVSGGGRVFLNYRFAQPGRFPRQHEHHLYPSDQFPFAYTVSTDPLTGKTDGILKRSEVDPLVIHTQTSSEYWQRRGSLVHTDSFGNDLMDHEKARIYLFASSQHHADPNSGPQSGIHQNLSNPLNTTTLLRALLDALDAWATKGTNPPNSCIPTHNSGTLVPAEAVKARFPMISGVTCPNEPNRLYVQNFGPDLDKGIISKEPPEEDIDKEYTILVPWVDDDGNDLAGIRTPHLEVPLATFTGWNFRRKGKILSGLVGSYLPFTKTAEERGISGDPRLSVEERYRSKAHYIRSITFAVQQLVNQRLLLEEDADHYVELAINNTDLWALRSLHSEPFQPR